VRFNPNDAENEDGNAFFKAKAGFRGEILS